MASRKTGSKHRSDSGEPRTWDGSTKQINPFNLGVTAGLDLDDARPTPVPGKDVKIPKDPRAKGR